MSVYRKSLVDKNIYSHQIREYEGDPSSAWGGQDVSNRQGRGGLATTVERRIKNEYTIILL